MQYICMEVSVFVVFVHSLIQVFPLICHPSVISCDLNQLWLVWVPVNVIHFIKMMKWQAPQLIKCDQIFVIEKIWLNTNKECLPELIERIG